jgi:hypothetical protein
MLTFRSLFCITWKRNFIILKGWVGFRLLRTVTVSEKEKAS